MPRANRYFVPDQVWHLTHRCHDQSFLLRDSRDRSRWCDWLREARSRYGLCILNYIVTCNHVHLLVDDRGEGEIARSMQLIAGRVAQEYNRRHSRAGQFWRDRYHSTAVESGMHLAACVVYIDLNMVRAGAVVRPADWEHSGFHEVRHRSDRGIVDRPRLAHRLGLAGVDRLREAHTTWHDSWLARDSLRRNPAWSESLALGSSSFVDAFRRRLGVRGLHCKKTDFGRLSTLHGRNYRPEKPETRPD